MLSLPQSPPPRRLASDGSRRQADSSLLLDLTYFQYRQKKIDRALQLTTPPPTPHTLHSTNFEIFCYHFRFPAAAFVKFVTLRYMLGHRRLQFVNL